ncbi:MAG: metallophosphoesterase [Candidatus Kaiserbacteria bacterium]|nr:metallophosphoesterase [Candidatus Kaiserbacteria bacterium]
MRTTIITFLLVLTGLLSLCSFVIYDAVALAFGITDTIALTILGSAIGLFTLSFIVSVFVTNWYFNALTRIWYTASAVWIGAFFYLFCAAIVYGLLVIFFPALSPIGAYLFAGAILVSTYGIYNARRIVVTQVPVTLPNLPASWMDRKAVWVSDLHLGQLHGPEFARAVVRRIAELSPSIIFLGGDIFDGKGAGDIPLLSEPLAALAAPQGVYFITGNHEEYGFRNEFVTAIRSGGMNVLDDEIKEIDGLQLIGVDYQSTSDAVRFKEILNTLSIDRDKPSILLKHEPKDLAIAEAAGISLQISGHTHQAQMWPLEYFAQRAYKGFAYGLNRLKNMQVYTSSGVGTWGPPLRVGTKSEIVVLTFK